MRFSSLGSGSEGNALLVEASQTRVLLDCGFGLQDSIVRLAKLGLSPDQLTGIVVTHEHGDHISGVSKLARKFNLSVWLTHGTLRACPKAFAHIAQLHEIDAHSVFSIDDLLLQPYPVPHDAVEPVQYVLSDGAHRLGVLTDVGASTPHIEAMLSGCDALVLECNHDSELLANGDYPHRLKQRVGGQYGHLSNQQAAALLAKLNNNRLQHLVAAHLSHKNNTPALASNALSVVLNCTNDWIGVATQHDGFAWREIL
jgi:phosphoribosyl 1,2-cyclic phosphodiesterase